MLLQHYLQITVASYFELRQICYKLREDIIRNYDKNYCKLRQIYYYDKNYYKLRQIYYRVRQNIIRNYDKNYCKLRQLYYKLRQCVITNYSSFITNYGKTLLQVTAAFLQITTVGYYKSRHGSFINILQIVAVFGLITNYDNTLLQTTAGFTNYDFITNYA